MKNLSFRKLSGDSNELAYGAKWHSRKLNNGEFDYWLVIELINMDEACGRDNKDQPRYNVSLSVVSPQQAGETNVSQALASCGPDLPEEQITDPMKVEALHGYGVLAITWQADGNNARKLLRDAKQEAAIQSGITFGFAMDRAVNRIGTTGWEALKGDLTAGLNRTIASGSIEGSILAKMHGIPVAS